MTVVIEKPGLQKLTRACAVPVFDRFVNQPSRHTFTMKAVRDFLDLHMDGGV